MSNLYHYTDGAKRFGPYSVEELQSKNISRETMVWCEGMDEWAPANTIPELANILAPEIPGSKNKEQTSHTNESQANTPQIPPKNYMVQAILVTLFCCLPFGIVSIINASKVESRFYAGDVAGSLKASADAKQWIKYSLIGWVVFLIIYFFFLMIGLSGY